MIYIYIYIYIYMEYLIKRGNISGEDGDGDRTAKKRSPQNTRKRKMLK